MQSISNTDGSDGAGDESSEADTSQQAATGKQYYKDLVKKANSVPLKILFKLYNLKIDEFNKNITCPFPKHKGKNYGGRESSPSFYFYPDTNSFWCFGCKVGIYATDFVAAIDNLNRFDAANKIIDFFESDCQLTDNGIQIINSIERLEFLMQFSNCIRDFMMDHINDPLAIQHAEKIAAVLDKLNIKHNLDIAALKTIILRLIEKVNSYKSHHTIIIRK